MIHKIKIEEMFKKHREERSENAHQDQQRHTFRNDNWEDWVTHKEEWVEKIHLADDTCNQRWDNEQADCYECVEIE